MSPEEFAAYYGTGGGQGGPAPLPPPGLPGGQPAPAPTLDPSVIPPFNYAAYFGAGAPAPAAPPPPPAGPPPPQGAEALPPSLQGALGKSLGAPPTDQPKTGPLPEYTGGPILGIAPPNATQGMAPPAALPATTSQAQVDQYALDASKAPGARSIAPVTVTPGGSKPRSSGGPGDFGMGKAERALDKTFVDEQGNIIKLADVERAKADALAAGMSVIGQDKILESQRRELEAQHQEQIFNAYQEETQRQIDEVRNKTVDPNRSYHSMGSKILAIIGAAMGGAYQGMNKLATNDFVDNMNKTIDRDIGLQEREIDGDRKAIAERKSLLGEMRATYKDKDFAKLQAKNLYYEGIKEQIAAEAATYESPTIAARAQQAITGVERQQAALGLQRAAQKASASAAAAAFQRAREQQEFTNNLEAYKANTGRISAEKEKTGGAGHTLAERFVGTGHDASGQPTGYLERDAANAAKREEARIAATRLLKNIDRVQEIRRNEGVLGRTFNDGAAEILYTPEWRSQLRAIHSEMLTDWGQAKGLKALSESDYKLAHGIIGKDFNGIGSATDDRLDELRRVTQRGLDAEGEAASGSRVVKHSDETIDPIGGSTRLNNQRGGPGDLGRRAP